MIELIDQLLDAPFFLAGLIVGIILCVVAGAIYVICVILFGVIDPEDSGVKKTLSAQWAEKKERNKRERRAVTNAERMIADGSLTPPGR